MSITTTAARVAANAVRALASGATSGSRAFLRTVGSQSIHHLGQLASLAKKDKGRFIAGLVAYGLLDEGFETIFNDLLAEDPTLGDTIAEAKAEISKYALAAGVDVTPNGDEKIAQSSEDSIAMSVGMYLTAKRYYEGAARVVGGQANLLALMHWLAVDDDLKQMVINHEYTR